MLRTVLALVARTVLVVVVPCVAVVIFGDGCYRGWTQLWTMCNDPSSFQETLQIAYYLYAYGSVGEEINVYGHIPVSLIEHNAICPASWFSDFQTGTCGRSIVSLLGPLLLKKLILAVLFSGLELGVWAALLRLSKWCANVQVNDGQEQEPDDCSPLGVEGMAEGPDPSEAPDTSSHG